MRQLVVVISLLISLCATSALAESDARSSSKRKKRSDVAVTEDARARKDRSQSFGRPAAGYLRNATELKMTRGAYVRRPHRAFGTRTTVDFTRRAILETRELHPRVHPIAIGDLSAKLGGPISDHNSHQSGRDVDLGLYYKKPPKGYPNVFINGTDANLDKPAMWTLISKLAATASKDGGVQVIYLDYDVQRILYEYAKQRGVSQQRLDKIFQYPHGNWSGKGIVRHYRNHAHHLHVRFKCSKADRNCS
jgi:murein endopeptidase